GLQDTARNSQQPSSTHPALDRASSESTPAFGSLSSDPGTTRPHDAPGPSFPEVPSLNLPKGGGAIRGIGEKFDVNLNTGTASFSLPIHVSPARGDIQPRLSLEYDS